MIAVFNIVVLALALLIAYWWANQGFLSAFLHFLCVVVAGAIALALWEPITVNWLLRGTGFDRFAWSVSFLGLFGISLFLLRIATDKIVPENLNLPTWANYTFGGLFGAGIGVLTMGMVLIGAGFAQSSVELMGFSGEKRSRAGQPTQVNSMWVPLHSFTADFYSFASAGSLSPTFTRTSLQRNYPGLDAMSMSLFRDSASDGTGMVALLPSAVTIDAFSFSPTVPDGLIAEGLDSVALVRLTFDQLAYDQGERLTLTASQARLIGRPGASRWADPPTAFPLLWIAPNAESGYGLHRFDDLSHVATGIPGQQSTTITLVFPARAFGNTPPEFIQIKGVRFRLPAVAAGPEGVAQMVAEAVTGSMAGGIGGPRTNITDAAAGGTIDREDLVVRNTLRRLNLSKNQITPMREIDNYLTEGRREFPYDSGFYPGAGLRIRGIYEPDGTRVVQLNVGRRRSSVDIFGDSNDARNTEGDSAPLVLVDTNGNRYQPIGYMWEKPEAVEIVLDPSRGIRTVGDLPTLPTAGTHGLWVIYRVTEMATIVEVQLGGTSLGQANLVVEGPRF